MKNLAALVAVCLISTACWAETPQQRFDQLAAQAGEFYQKKAYDEAAAVIEKMAADPVLAGRTEWPDRLYDLARNYALIGQTDKALTALEKATGLGALVSAGDVEKQPDLASLRDSPRFKAVVEMLKRRARLWQDDPALATPYKPVLSDEEKVAGLSKIWAEARFNFPFFDRVPELGWDATYMAYLPQVRAAQTTDEYYRVLTRFIAVLKDGHSRVIPPSEVLDRHNAIVAVNTRLIEGKIIITAVGDPALEAKGVRTGLEIVTIDGRPALDYADKEIEPYVAGFTPQDRAVWKYGFLLLRGPIDKPVRLTLCDAKNKSFTIDVPRVHNTWAYGMLPKLAVLALFKILPGNIAYLQINEFQDDAGIKTLKENFAAATAAKGLIIDIRQNGGGDDRNGLNIVRILADKPFKGSNWRTVNYKAADRSWSRPVGWFRAGGGEYKPDPDLHYGKPVVVMIGGRTYSAAEDFTVAFLSLGRGKLVGETTGGSSGNPMLFKLPGGGLGIICTKDDSFPNGRVFEGVGIAPDIEVKPTIADIRAGRDPILQKAIAVIESSL